MYKLIDSQTDKTGCEQQLVLEADYSVVRGRIGAGNHLETVVITEGRRICSCTGLEVHHCRCRVRGVRILGTVDLDIQTSGQRQGVAEANEVGAAAGIQSEVTLGRSWIAGGCCRLHHDHGQFIDTQQHTHGAIALGFSLGDSAVAIGIRVTDSHERLNITGAYRQHGHLGAGGAALGLHQQLVATLESHAAGDINKVINADGDVGHYPQETRGEVNL